jgi:hypothetical protein
MPATTLSAVLQISASLPEFVLRRKMTYRACQRAQIRLPSRSGGHSMKKWYS